MTVGWVKAFAFTHAANSATQKSAQFLILNAWVKPFVFYPPYDKSNQPFFFAGLTMRRAPSATKSSMSMRMPLRMARRASARTRNLVR